MTIRVDDTKDIKGGASNERQAWRRYPFFRHHNVLKIGAVLHAVDKIFIEYLTAMQKRTTAISCCLSPAGIVITLALLTNLLRPTKKFECQYIIK